ncbi:fasciclin [Oscillatoriales cyanobacterium USR001]|nr:fasciclin [Oscillatoriales cyanobacterium USR001]
MDNLLNIVTHAGCFKTLLMALETASLVELLQAPGSYTILAPTDEAFVNIPANLINAWMEEIPKIKKIIRYHIILGDIRANDFLKLNVVETLEGSTIAVNTSNGIKVNDAKVIKADIIAENGVVHIIDKVLIPEGI